MRNDASPSSSGTHVLRVARDLLLSARRFDAEEALRWGVATGTASATLPGLRLASLEQATEIYRQVEVRRIE